MGADLPEAVDQKHNQGLNQSGDTQENEYPWSSEKDNDRQSYRGTNSNKDIGFISLPADKNIKISDPTTLCERRDIEYWQCCG